MIFGGNSIPQRRADCIIVVADISIATGIDNTSSAPLGTKYHDS